VGQGSIQHCFKKAFALKSDSKAQEVSFNPLDDVSVPENFSQEEFERAGAPATSYFRTLLGQE